MCTGKITIKETDEGDLPNIMELWNNGEVMSYVGFPNGLCTTMEKLKQWINGVNRNIFRKHYSIYAEGIGYRGETYYSVDTEHDLATLDIKLLPRAQGKGIAAYALSFSIHQVFDNNLATKAYVDPNPENRRAWRLYKKLGFVGKSRPEYLVEYETYLEITKDNWNK